jgi:hypothetical protein
METAAAAAALVCTNSLREIFLFMIQVYLCSTSILFNKVCINFNPIKPGTGSAPPALHEIGEAHFADLGEVRMGDRLKLCNSFNVEGILFQVIHNKLPDPAIAGKIQKVILHF